MLFVRNSLQILHNCIIMAKENQTISPQEQEDMPARKAYREYVKKRYPENIPENDDGWPELEDRYAADTEAMLTKYKESENLIQEMVTLYPEFGGMILDIAVNKMPPRAAIAKYFAQEDLIPKEGDEDYSAYQEAYNERKGKNEARINTENELMANQEQTIKTIDDFCAAKGYDEVKKTALLDKIETTFNDMLMKKVTSETLEAFDKAMNYEEDMKIAGETAAINAKNEAIEAKNAEDKPGDNVPMATGTGTMQGGKKENKFFENVGKRRGI